jgi:hypothetical protein
MSAATVQVDRLKSLHSLHHLSLSSLHVYIELLFIVVVVVTDCALFGCFVVRLCWCRAPALCWLPAGPGAGGHQELERILVFGVFYITDKMI